MAKEITCKICGGPHYQTFCYQRPKKFIEVKKRPRKVSSKERLYWSWLREVAWPAVRVRDGELCACCRKAYATDLDHIKNKGSHPELKRDLNNLQGLCRSCHRNKTDHKPCVHG